MSGNGNVYNLIIKYSNTFELLYKFCNILIGPDRAKHKNLLAKPEITARLTSLL